MDDLYLDANATTPVLPAAREAALAAMAQDFGNPSSVHSTGLRARALMDGVRATARRVLGVSSGQLLFVSGATEGIQTAVLSALMTLRQPAAGSAPDLLLYGATEHKAVPEALQHWVEVLGLRVQILAIPVDARGRHDLAWLRAHAPRAGLVCTMAANNETGVVSDLDGIADALLDSSALWLVDGVQALGKLDLALARRRIDYAPFSGHKLYAPKGIGLLYVHEGAPFTPLMAGGGQEGALRSGTENMAGIAALGAVLQALEAGDTFQPAATLARWRDQLAAALQESFPGLVFNAPLAGSLPTTLNFSVPGLSSKLLLDLFDAAGIRVSGGSACSAAKAAPSHVLVAMGLPAWQAESAVRLSFGPASDQALINEACARLRACGASLRQSCLLTTAPAPSASLDGVTTFTVDGACCYLLVDAGSRRALVIDPLPALTVRLVQLLSCQGLSLMAVLDTHSHGDHASSADALWAAMPPHLTQRMASDTLGWPEGADVLRLGQRRLTRLAIPGHTTDSTAYLLHGADGAVALAFVGDTVIPGAMGRSDFAQSAPLAFAGSLRTLAETIGPHTLLLPGHDYDQQLATTLTVERAAQPLLGRVLAGELDSAGLADAKAALERELPPTNFQTMACGARVSGGAGHAAVEMTAARLAALCHARTGPIVVDVREGYEQHFGGVTALADGVQVQQVPVSRLANALPGWQTLSSASPMVFVCRSGSRSAQVARALRRLGIAQAWSLAGGLAMWRPAAVTEQDLRDLPCDEVKA